MNVNDISTKLEKIHSLEFKLFKKKENRDIYYLKIIWRSNSFIFDFYNMITVRLFNSGEAWHSLVFPLFSVVGINSDDQEHLETVHRASF